MERLLRRPDQAILNANAAGSRGSALGALLPGVSLLPSIATGRVGRWGKKPVCLFTSTTIDRLSTKLYFSILRAMLRQVNGALDSAIWRKFVCMNAAVPTTERRRPLTVDKLVALRP